MYSQSGTKTAVLSVPKDVTRVLACFCTSGTSYHQNTKLTKGGINCSSSSSKIDLRYGDQRDILHRFVATPCKPRPILVCNNASHYRTIPYLNDNNVAIFTVVEILRKKYYFHIKFGHFIC